MPDRPPSWSESSGTLPTRFDHTPVDSSAAVEPSGPADPGDPERLRSLFPDPRFGFDLIDVLGTGGFGAVFLGKERSINHRVAIKVLHPHLATDQHLVDYLRGEAERMAVVRSDRVAKIFRFEDAARPPFIVMEFVEGHTLEVALGRRIDGQRRALAIPDATLFARWIAEALRDLHERLTGVAIAHRDLTLRNIMLLPVEGVKLLDLGLGSAACRRRRDGRPGGDFGVAVGYTPEYAAPEQIRGQESTTAADWFSFGTILFEMLTGRLPFGDGARAEYAAQVLDAPARWSLMPPLPSPLMELVERCLVKDPRERTMSASRALELLAATAGGAAQPSLSRVPSHNVPSLHDEAALIDRDEDVDAIAASLRRSSPGITVLHGAPGAGKTRLAQESLLALLRTVPAPWSWRICWVSLRGFDESRGVAAVCEAIADTLSSLDGGRPIDRSMNALACELEGARVHTVIALDNADEDVAPIVAGLAAKLRSATPRVQFLITTTDPDAFSGLPGLRPVLPLRTPMPNASAQGIRESPAVALFAAFMAQSRPGFQVTDRVAPAIGAICSRLGGLPLALRLAASVRRFDPHELLANLDSIMQADLDRVGPYPSIGAVLRTGLDRLTPGERHLLARLSVFRGGFRDGMVTDVCADPGTPGLVDGQPTWARLEALEQRGMIGPVGNGRRAIFEPIRAASASLLDAGGERAALEQRFVDAHLALVRQSIVGQQPEDWTPDSEKAWIDRLVPERENLQQVWNLAMGIADGARRGLVLTSLVRGLDLLWRERGVPTEAWRWCEVALGHLESMPSDHDRMSLLNAVASTAHELGRLDDADRIWCRARAIAESSGSRGHALIFAANLSLSALRRDHLDEAIQRAEDGLAVARELGLAASTSEVLLCDEPGPSVLQALVARADAFRNLFQLDRARREFESLALTLERVDDPVRLHDVEVALAEIAILELGANGGPARSGPVPPIDGRAGQARSWLVRAMRRNRSHRGNRREAALVRLLSALLREITGDARAGRRVGHLCQRYLALGGRPDRMLRQLLAQRLDGGAGPAVPFAEPRMPSAGRGEDRREQPPP